MFFAAIITNTNQLQVKLLLFVVFPLHIKPEQSGLWCFVSTVITVYTAVAVAIIACCDHEHEPNPWGAQIHYGRPVQIQSVFICDWSLVWKITYTLFLLQRLGLPTCSNLWLCWDDQNILQFAFYLLPVPSWWADCIHPFVLNRT